MMELAETPVIAHIGLGGNVGDVAATLDAALAGIDALPDTRVIATSLFYRTAPVGGIAQDDFINAVARIETRLSAPALLDGLFAIERAHGRDRDRQQRWGPRTLDLDLLLYGDERIDVDGLTVPHPRIAERAFVLVPLLEVSPQVVIPGIGPARDALAMIGTCGCEALG